MTALPSLGSEHLAIGDHAASRYKDRLRFLMRLLHWKQRATSWITAACTRSFWILDTCSRCLPAVRSRPFDQHYVHSLREM